MRTWKLCHSGEGPLNLPKAEYRVFCRQSQLSLRAKDKGESISTHLPWLSDYFRQYDEGIRLYDPSDRLMDEIETFITEGEGIVEAVITESENHPASEFLQILDRLGIDLDIEIIR